MTKIFVAGHRGMVGSAICSQLETTDAEIITASREEIDLTNQSQVKFFFKENKFDQVYLAAAKVGGIHANNTYPADFIYENLMIQNNVINSAFISDVKKIMFLGSSCIYPKFAKQPMNENELLNGLLESTNEPYAIAKIAGIKMCESYNRQHGTDYRCVMPTNLYGPGDNYHSQNSHVIPALIRRIHDAKESGASEITAWGSGMAMREFLYVDDMANASIFCMNLDIKKYHSYINPMLSHINIGTGADCSIKDLTECIADIIGFKGRIKWDLSKPDGSPRKLLDVSLLKNLGWNASEDLKSGLIKTYQSFIANKSYRGK
ncbi:GDP-L-fucose synthase [Gammaproteobacteria bacterium]|nr:GDP-L-fucose synthase [Gammaproteobacteria bacterium]|tara:strand:+ start:2172 stop:3128 length:957 start_codon:yes stop_codon:yes gene_type:complete